MIRELRYLNKNDKEYFKKKFTPLLNKYEEQSSPGVPFENQTKTTFDICEEVISNIVPLIYNLDQKANELFNAGNVVGNNNRRLKIENGNLSNKIHELEQEIKELRSRKKKRL